MMDLFSLDAFDAEGFELGQFTNSSRICHGLISVSQALSNAALSANWKISSRLEAINRERCPCHSRSQSV
jgi:hypothetical protein